MKTLKFTLLFVLISLSTIKINAQWSTIPGITDERLFAVYTLNSEEALIGGKDGLLFRTSDNGDNWSTISPTEEDIADIVFTDENTGYIAAGSLILQTADGANTWSSIATGSNDELTSLCFTEAQTGYASTAGGDVIKTTDAGATWQVMSTGSTQELAGIDFGDANTGIAVGAAGTPYYTLPMVAHPGRPPIREPPKTCLISVSQILLQPTSLVGRAS